MNENNRTQIIIAAGLGVVLVGVLFYQFVIKGGAPPLREEATQRPAQTRTAAAPALSPGQVAQELRRVDIDIPKLIDDVQPVHFDYLAVQIDRDPMDSLVGSTFLTAPGQGPAVPQGIVTEIRRKVVTGIVYDGENSVAIVDNELVSVGHTYDNDVMVHEIASSRVTFKVGDTMIPVDLKEIKEY